MAKSLSIDITDEIDALSYHLSDNRNIVLSAPFGNGKSYLLDKFKQEKEDQYYFITIYPISYTIAENADILECIKRDILFQLMRDELITDHTDFNAVCGSLFTAENMKVILDAFLQSADNSGILRGLSGIILNAKEKYEQKKTTVTKAFQWHQYHKGGLYEDDLLTQIIRAGIKASNKPSVLIIEDLDRVDPAHLFRLLNVFSSQSDRVYVKDKDCSSNKFGFDKTIYVLDYKQTERHYEHFYGNNTSYKGYMSKIMTSIPFAYSITDKARKELANYIYSEIGINQQSKLKDFLNQKISKLSVREIVEITQKDPRKFVKSDNYKIDDEDFSPVNTATKALFYMTLLGATKREFKSNFSPNFLGPYDAIRVFCPIILYCNRTKYLEIGLDNIKDNTARLSFDNGKFDVSFTKTSVNKASTYITVVNNALEKVFDITHCSGLA